MKAVKRQDHPVTGGTMSAYHFGDQTQPIKLVMLHANGFNGRCYRMLLEAQNIRSVSLDLRGHGFTKLPYDPESIRDFYQFRDDVLDFITRYVDGPFVLAGHSMGASTAILCAPSLKENLKGFVGFDSPIMPLWMYPFMRLPAWHRLMRKRLPIAAGAGRRRSVFDSKNAAFQRYKNRGLFKKFSDDVLLDYVEGGLVERDGAFHLACDPKWEQAIFPSHAHDLFGAAKDLPKDNSAKIFASVQPPSSPLARLRLRRILGHENVKIAKGFDHMFPLNQPDYAKAVLSDVIAKANLI